MTVCAPNILAFSLMLAAFVRPRTAAGAPADEVLFDAKAEETIQVRTTGSGDDRRSVVEQQKVAFHYITLWGNAKETPDRQVIAKETLRQVLDHAREGVKSDLRVDLFFTKQNLGKFPTAPTQTIEVPDAHEAHFENGYWTATTLGCCDAEPYSRMYAYGTDHPFLRYNGDFWKVEVPNAHGLDRYVGLVIRGHVPNNAALEAIFGNNKTAVAAVSLAAPGKLLDTLYVVPKPGVDEDRLGLHTEKLELRGNGPKDEQRSDVRLVTLWSLDGAQPATAGAKSIKGVTVEAGLFVDDGTTETIQAEIRDDKFVGAKVNGAKLNGAKLKVPSREGD